MMSANLKLKTLESYLQELHGFNKPKLNLEQYETPAHIAAIILHTIQTQYGDIEDKLVLDAGCGTGKFALGAAMLGAGAVTALDIDRDSLHILKDNIEEQELKNIDVIHCNFLNNPIGRWNNYYDTVVMNPPFGTKHNTGIDMKFVQMGLSLSCNVVYSLHKTTTRDHIQKKVKDWGVNGEVIAELKFNIHPTYKFHKEQSRDIAVDVWRIHH